MNRTKLFKHFFVFSDIVSTMSDPSTLQSFENKKAVVIQTWTYFWVIKHKFLKNLRYIAFLILCVSPFVPHSLLTSINKPEKENKCLCKKYDA